MVYVVTCTRQKADALTAASGISHSYDDWHKNATFKVSNTIDRKIMQLILKRAKLSHTAHSRTVVA